jgi:hypothetical protein
MFAPEVVILRDKYREIGHSTGECNRKINRMRAKVRREFLEGAFKQAIEAEKCGFLCDFAGKKTLSAYSAMVGCGASRGPSIMPRRCAS